ncbi:unnamed protein product [Cuscuta campestris]|uniref:TF-B3 domain-containing protein n=1 Tax=Cuscuta campestris TaxID=132261 RepID=A0A484KQB9_9ASTE|nr:unnamed protein product [Cuscuta campestris]
MIPEKYAKKYGDELGDTVKLNLANGREWEVHVVKAKDAVWFHRGLESFIKDNSIGIHYLLLFNYAGNSRFNVHVFDLTATEIDYSEWRKWVKLCIGDKENLGPWTHIISVSYSQLAMPEPTFTSSDKNNKTKTLGQEIMEAVLAMTNRISHHHHHHQKHGQKVGDPSQAGEEDGPTNSVITLAGTNTGASMKGEMGKKMSGAEGENEEEEEEQLKTYVNSNFQAINNSIMLGGSYSSNDPGVHLEVVDYMEEEEEPQPEKTKKKRKNKGKKIVEESSHSKEQRESD